MTDPNADNVIRLHARVAQLERAERGYIKLINQLKERQTQLEVNVSNLSVDLEDAQSLANSLQEQIEAQAENNTEQEVSNDNV